MKRRPVLLAFLLEAGIGLLIALALMEGRGYRAGLYGGLAVLVGIALYFAHGERWEDAPRAYPERHVQTGSFKGATQKQRGLWIVDKSHSVYQQKRRTS